MHVSSITIASIVALTAVTAPVRAQSAPVLNENAELKASDGFFGDQFGYSVAVSGETVVITAPLDDDTGINSGTAYVFERDANGVWTQQVKLHSPDSAAEALNNRFGYSVAIDGDTAIVGAIGGDGNGFIGSAIVFVRDANGVWTQQDKLLASDGAPGDHFGRAVAIDGDTAVIGADQDTDNGNLSGSAYVFTRDAAGVWTQQTKLLASDGSFFGLFGTNVAINGDTIFVGAVGANGVNPLTGAVYVFVRDSSGAWSQQDKLIDPNGQGNYAFGTGVAILGDTAIIGECCSGPGQTQFGSTFVFVRDSTGAWSQQVRLTPSDATAGDSFGSSVAFIGDTLLIGADQDDDNGACSGSAYIFTRDATGAWSEQAKLLSSDGASDDRFGFTVALNADTAFVGAFKHDMPLDSGAAYVFDLPSQGNPADLNGDGVVNGADLATLLTQWGTNGPADLNNDGVVNGADLATLLTNWGAV